MDTLLILIAVVLVLYFTINIMTTYSETLYIESDIDHNKYIIRRGNTKSEDYLMESANTLAEINIRVIKLINHLQEKYKNDTGKIYFIHKLKDNYGSDILSEAAIDNRYTTYTIDKKDMHVCLRHRDQTEKVYDINLLMYVVIHEMSHFACPEIGHGDLFQKIFKKFCEIAIKINILTFDDYSVAPIEYCGMILSSSVLK